MSPGTAADPCEEAELGGQSPEGLVSEDRCGECCEQCCPECCDCDRFCRRCRQRCGHRWCRRCCRLGCCSCCVRGAPPEQAKVTVAYALKHVADESVLLGCLLQFRMRPLLYQRVLLLMLFLVTAVFVQYAEKAIGPICVREYLAECPAFTAPSGFPFEHITLAPPGITVPEGTAVRYRRIQAVDDQPLLPSASLFGGEPVSEEPRSRATRRLDTGTGTVAVSDGERSGMESVRDSILARLTAMFGQSRFDCSMPMCDIFYPQMIDWISLWRLTNSIWGTTTSHPVPFTSEAVLVGYCKCEGPLYDGVPTARVTNEARSFMVTLILQTLLPKLFRAALECSAGGPRGADESTPRRCQGPKRWFHGATVAALLATVAWMCLGLLLLEFDPEGWRAALAASAFSTPSWTRSLRCCSSPSAFAPAGRCGDAALRPPPTSCSQGPRSAGAVAGTRVRSRGRRPRASGGPRRRWRSSSDPRAPRPRRQASRARAFDARFGDLSGAHLIDLFGGPQVEFVTSRSAFEPAPPRRRLPRAQRFRRGRRPPPRAQSLKQGCQPAGRLAHRVLSRGARRFWR
ncbi:unnamed protein product [Prorocentrum cordatum]|uniref:Uncharacterized protein n=1 Tax=Prorocentrum cordatum TaxID=2364126 RepID=A0ABN9TNR8_9DINO|nr:unnamed protein product [Polarella glacialis]